MMTKEQKELLSAFVRCIVEAKLREVDLDDGKKSKFGSDEHIKDLETRIASLVLWRDRQKKGTEARANYARLVTRLRSELLSAKKANIKEKANLEATSSSPEEAS